MNLSLAFSAINLVLHSVHRHKATLLCSNAVKEADGINANKVKNTSKQECQADVRIISGSETSEDRFSYAVSLGGCSGSLITRDIVLTTVHCRGAIDYAKLGLNNMNNVDG
jgi:hypothetical protein